MSNSISGILLQLRDDLFWRSLGSLVPPNVPSVSLDVGSGPEPRNPFNLDQVLGIDLFPGTSSNVIKGNLAVEAIPMPPCSVGVVTAFDFLEHVPRVVQSETSTRFPFVDLMSEIWRVLDDGGLFYSYTPVYPSRHAFGDPTHVNIMSKDTLSKYFCGPTLARRYGFIGKFQMLRQGKKGVHQYSMIKKIANV